MLPSIAALLPRDWIALPASPQGGQVHRYTHLLLSFLSRFLFSKPVYAQSTVVHSVHGLAAVLAMGILGSGPLAGQVPGSITNPFTEIPGTITNNTTITVPSTDFPSPQQTNGILIVGTGKDDNSTLNIRAGGEVTVGGADLGQAPKSATGTVNVTGPNATWRSNRNDIVVGENGTGKLTVTDDGFVQSAASIIIGDKGGRNNHGSARR